MGTYDGLKQTQARGKDKADEVGLWLIMSMPDGKMIARLWRGTGDKMAPTIHQLEEKSLEALRARLTEIGCEQLQKQVGKVQEIWVEPST